MSNKNGVQKKCVHVAIEVNIANKAEKCCFSEKLSTVRDRLTSLGSPLHSLFSLANRIP